MPGRNAWCQRNIAERLTFSSFTSLRDDLWGVGKARPFAIVALPDYKVPHDLDQTSKDALWLSEAPVERRVVWDGYCPHALHEVIYECFGFAPGSIDGKIGVFQMSNGIIGPEVEETRSAEVLRLRPRKAAGMTQFGCHNHLAELFAWSRLFGARDGGKKPHLKNGGAVTRRLYGEFYTHNPANYTTGKKRNDAETPDSIARETGWSAHAELLPARTPEGLCRGWGNGVASHAGEAQRYVGDDVRNEISAIAEGSISLLSAGAGGPESFYEALLPRSRNQKTGIILGAQEAAGEDFEETLARVRPESSQPGPDLEDMVDETAPAAVQSKSWLSRIMASARKKSTGF